MNLTKLNRRMQHLLGAAMVAGLALGVAACGGEEVVEPPPAPTYSAITVFMANPDYSSADFLTTADTATGVTYGTAKRMQAQNGISGNLTVKQPSGNVLGQTLVSIDSASLSWGVLTFNSTGAQEVLKNTVQRPTPNASAPLIRLYNVSSSVGEVDLNINTADGLKVATQINYNIASSFTSGGSNPSLLERLVVTKHGTTDSITSVPAAFEAGKIYTVVVYGNDAATSPDNKVKAVVVEEP